MPAVIAVIVRASACLSRLCAVMLGLALGTHAAPAHARDNVPTRPTTSGGPAYPVKSIPDHAAIVHAEYATKGYAALARGQAQAAGAVFDSVRQDFSANLAALRQWMRTPRVKANQGYADSHLALRDTTLITRYSSANERIGSPAGKDMVAWIEDNGGADQAVLRAVSREDAAFAQISSALSTAVTANFTGHEEHRRQALASARSAAESMGSAATAFLQAQAQHAVLADRLGSLGVELNHLVLRNRRQRHAERFPDGCCRRSGADRRRRRQGLPQAREQRY